MITPFPGNTPRRASSVAVGSVFIRCTLKVKLATLCLEARLGAIGEFSRNEWLGVEWVANRQEMDVEPDSKPQRTVIDLSYYSRLGSSW